MPYRDRLNRWAIVRLLPKMQRIVVARHRTEFDAEGHCRILRRLMPDAEFLVVFDPVSEADSEVDSERMTHPIATGLAVEGFWLGGAAAEP